MKTTKFQAIWRGVFLSCVSAALLGCAASSMRIQVDVYKGPLSNTEVLQANQLHALFTSVQPALDDISYQLNTSASLLECDKYPENNLKNNEDQTILDLKSSNYASSTSEDREQEKKGVNRQRVCAVYKRVIHQVSGLEQMYQQYQSTAGDIANRIPNNALPDLIKNLQKLRGAPPQSQCEQNAAQLFCQSVSKAIDTLIAANKSNNQQKDQASTYNRLLVAALQESLASLNAAEEQLSNNLSMNPLHLAPAFNFLNETRETESARLVKGLKTEPDYSSQVTALGGIPNITDLVTAQTALNTVTLLLGKNLDQTSQVPATLSWASRIKDDLNSAEFVQPRLLLAYQENYFSHTISLAEDLKPMQKVWNALNTDLDKLYNAAHAGLNHHTLAQRLADLQNAQAAIIVPIETDDEALTRRFTELLATNTSVGIEPLIASVAAAKASSIGKSNEILALEEQLTDITSLLSNYKNDPGALKQALMNLKQAKRPVNHVAVLNPAEFTRLKASLNQNTQRLNKSIKAALANLQQVDTELLTAINALKQAGVTPQSVMSFNQLNQARKMLQPKIMQVKTLIKQLAPQDLAEQARKEAALGNIADLATRFRILATYISYQIASVGASGSKRLMIDLAKTANLAAEASNQLSSRANALSLQMGTDGEAALSRNNISTGQYLRDSQPTAFIEIYDWLGASTDNGQVSVRERIDIAKRLFKDDNWAHINEVYASGSGTTSMAFIKDAIGNWNLKSFENDPTELISAYTDFTTKLVKKAISVSGGGSIEAMNKASNLLSAAQQVQIGGDAATNLQAGKLMGSLDLNKVRTNYQNRIEDIYQETQDEIQTIESLSADNYQEHTDHANQLESLIEDEVTRRNIQLGTDDKNTVVEQYKNSAKEKAKTEGIAALGAVVQEYHQLIKALQTVATTDAVHADLVVTNKP